MASALEQEGFTVLGIDDVASATTTAADGVPHTIIATGSLSVVAEVIACVKGISIETYPTIRSKSGDYIRNSMDSSDSTHQRHRS